MACSGPPDAFAESMPARPRPEHANTDKAPQPQPQVRPKLLISGSPTRARTWDLRINSPSEKWPESRIQLGFPGFRLGNRLADFALVSPGSPPITLFQFPNPFSPVVLSDGLNFY